MQVYNIKENLKNKKENYKTKELKLINKLEK